MNNIIQALECDATNGKEHFCMLSEKKLGALKELSRRDYEEYNQLKSNWKTLKEWLEEQIPTDKTVCTKRIKLLDILAKIKELQNNNE